ncbi:MAG: response regulator [Rivularia sp. ALOHA_DT_140]|nr:response regulator [Rivularia sp. ALOHA_DT_140]
MVHLKILLVEDNQSWQKILESRIRRALKGLGYQDSDYTIKVVDTFDEAYQALQESDWHLLVTDIELKDSSPTTQEKLGTELVPFAHNLNVPTLTVAGSSPLSYQNTNYFPKQNFDGKEFINQVQMLLK